MIALYERRCTILFILRILIKAVEVFKKIEAQLTTLASHGLEVVGILPIKRWVERTPLASGVWGLFVNILVFRYIAQMSERFGYHWFSSRVADNIIWLALLFGTQRYYQVRLRQQAIRMKHDEAKAAAYLDTLVGLGVNYPG